MSKPIILRREELNKALWKAADILRGTVDAGDYKFQILSMLFLKRINDVFAEEREQVISEWRKRGKSQKEAEAIADDPDNYRFFVPKDARWARLMQVGENRAEAIDKAMNAIEEQNERYLGGALAGERFNNPQKFGAPDEMDSLMQRLLNHFDTIPLGNRNLSDPDVLGNAYEYLIERFAEGSGKKGGEFYTPRPVVKVLVELLQPTEGMRIHDPTAGSGGMLIGSGNYVEGHGGDPRNLTLTGQEKNLGTLSIGKLNMILHGFTDSDMRGGDTIRSPKFQEGGSLVRYDRVIANPPFSLDEWGQEMMLGKDEHGKEKVVDPWRRFTRGVPPKGKGDMAFLSHMVEVANDAGMVGVVMPHGVLFRGSSEKTIRQALLNEDMFEAVVGLTDKLFFGTGIPASLLILDKKKPKTSKGMVLFIDASPEGFFTPGTKRNDLRTVDIIRIAAVYRGYKACGELSEGEVREQIEALKKEWIKGVEIKRKKRLGNLYEPDQAVRDDINAESDAKVKEIEEAAKALLAWLDEKHPGGRSSLEKFASVVKLDEIAEEHDYNLNISRYVDPTDPPQQLDVAKELKKLRAIEGDRAKAEAEMDRLLKELGYEG